MALLGGPVLQLLERAERGEERAEDRAEPIQPATRPASTFQPSAIRIVPRAGTPGPASRRWRRSSAQLRQLVDVDRQPAAVDRDDQAEADHDLTRGHDHHDQGEDLAVAVAGMRAKAISARLPAFSISSRQSRITSGLRRVSTPAAPMQKMTAERTTYQVMSIRASSPGSAPRGRAGACASTTAPTAATSSRNEAASNGTRNFVQQQLADLGRRAEAGLDVRAPMSSASRPEPTTAIVISTKQRTRQREPNCPERARLAGRCCDWSSRPRRRHEHVEHHHRARVDHDLGSGEELRLEQQEQHRQRDQVPDQREHAVERVAQHHDAEGAGDRAQRGDEEHDLLEEQARLRLLALAPQRRALGRGPPAASPW